MMRKRIAAVLAGTSLAALAGASAFAADKVEKKDAELTEVVVTGTQIRGLAPVGANVIGMSEEKIQATGANDTGELLTNLPQATNLFNDDNPAAGGGVIGGNARTAVIRPNLRNLPGGNNSSGAQTLLLVDGHRVIGAGIGILAVDPELVPPGALQRVEAMTDGASAIYGSDAIGGIINFITRRDFKGIEVSANYGSASPYTQRGANVTAGTSWTGGSGLISYSYAYHDALFGRDRDFITLKNWQTGVPTARSCTNSQITRSSAPTAVYAGTSPLTPSTAAALNCDYTDDATFSPETKRHNVFLSAQQKFTDKVRMEVQGFYQTREDLNIYGGLRPGNATSTALSVVVPNTNYYRTLAGIPSTETVNAFFTYGSVLGNASQTGITDVKSWQISPTLTWDVGGSWQLRALATMGESKSEYDNLLVNTTLQTAALASNSATTALNPFNISATQNLQVIRDIASFHDRGESRNKLTNVRVIADGALLEAPGGTIRLAVGAEYLKNDYRARITDQTTRTFAPWGEFAQSVTSQFLELSVPLVGEGNQSTGVKSLALSLSARRDKYNDFGETNNPRVGVTYKPVDWIELRGSWGTSFNAPTAPDGVGVVTGPRIRILPASAGVPTGVTVPAPPVGGSNVSLIIDQAPVPNMQPQTARNYGFGFNIRPPFVDGLSVDVGYYKINLKGLINFPFASTINAGFAQFGTQFLDISVTPADVAATLATNPATGPGLAQQLVTNNQQVVTIIDNRFRNLGDAELSGVDFALRYDRATNWGSYDLSLGGNRQFSLDVTRAGVTTDSLQFATVLRTSLAAGAKIGNLRAQLTLNRTGARNLAASTTLYNQTKADAFNVVNAFFRYDFQGQGPSVSLTINNLLDKDPPELRESADLNAGFTNGFTLGRLVQLGVSKRF